MGDIIRTLSNLKAGQNSTIIAIDNLDIQKRLQSYGITIGNIISCLYKSFDNQSQAFYIKGTIIALRKQDCHLIFIN